jgi:hypothetical protein
MGVDCSKEFEERFDWRRNSHIQNLSDLSAIANPGGSHSLKSLPFLASSLSSDDPKDALRWSIMMLWLQASECYIFGQFEPCILTCGAVLERCLKLEYQESKGHLPSGNWSLGKCAFELDWEGTRITSEILNKVKECIHPRNCRAHALLEHSNPQLSIIGGAHRGIKVLSNDHYLVEPYKGEAIKLISNTWFVLSSLYGKEKISNEVWSA